MMTSSDEKGQERAFNRVFVEGLMALFLYDLLVVGNTVHHFVVHSLDNHHTFHLYQPMRTMLLFKYTVTVVYALHIFNLRYAKAYPFI